MAPSTRIPNLYTQIIELAQEQRTNSFMAKINLGGTSGGGGGAGSPPGGFLGRLPQTRVAYDTTEGASASTGSSASLLDNLNHIRARLASLEAGGSGGSAGVGQGADFTQVEYSGADINLGLTSDGGWVDADAVHAALVVTPAASGTYQVTFNFSLYNAWVTTGTIMVAFRLTDGTVSLSAVVTSSHPAFVGEPARIHAIDVSGLFTWQGTAPVTVKLQKWTTVLSGTPTTNSIIVSAGAVVHMDAFRLGGGSQIGDEAYERSWWGW